MNLHNFCSLESQNNDKMYVYENNFKIPIPKKNKKKKN